MVVGYVTKHPHVSMELLAPAPYLTYLHTYMETTYITLPTCYTYPHTYVPSAYSSTYLVYTYPLTYLPLVKGVV
jgi:hypothetical protein